MKITNKYNLPKVLYDAVVGDRYDNQGSDYSVTKLVSPVYMSRLLKEYEDQIEVDVSSMLPLLQGTATHKILELANKDSDCEIEKRYFAKIDGLKISGQVDYYDRRSGTIRDYKNTSVWSVINGPKTEWVQQLNMLAYLVYCEDSSNRINTLEIVALMSDWKKVRYKRERGNYPEIGARVICIKLWPLHEAKSFIERRVREFEDAMRKPISEISPCSKAERYESEVTYAVMRKNKKRAIKICDTHEEARQYITNDNMYIDTRPSVRTRCEDYCYVEDVCPDFQKHKENKN